SGARLTLKRPFALAQLYRLSSSASPVPVVGSEPAPAEPAPALPGGAPGRPSVSALARGPRRGWASAGAAARRRATRATSALPRRVTASPRGLPTRCRLRRKRQTLTGRLLT